LLVTPGAIFADDNSFVIEVPTQLSISMAASGIGGIGSPSGELASLWYYVWLWADSTGTNPPGATADADEVLPTVPPGYDKKKLIGAVYNDAASDIRPFLNGDAPGGRRRILWNLVPASLTVLSGGVQTVSTPIDVTAFVPHLIQNSDGVPRGSMLLNVIASGGDPGNYISIGPGPSNVLAPTPIQVFAGDTAAGSQQGSAFPVAIPWNNQGPTLHYLVSGTISATIVVVGFELSLY
jgi:hypothetical protein